eukprot:m.219486 g.219486  ORF g.219486 m.219486 type:complete len:414 (-) comp10174_c0_seq1:18-1259(-)
MCSFGLGGGSLLLAVLLEVAEEALLLLGGLEATMTELGRGVDELQDDLLGGTAVDLGEQGLAQSQNTLLGTNSGALQHQEVVRDDTVVREATHGGDVLLRQISLGGAIVLDNRAIGLLDGLADAVDLLVLLRAVVEAVLTSAGHGVLDARRMPRANAGHLAQTLVGLAGQLADTPTVGDTLETVTLGDTDDVDLLVLLEDSRDANLLLEVLLDPVDLLLDGAAVDLDLGQVGLLGAEGQLVHLSVGEDADDLAVLDNAVQLLLELLLALLGGQVLGVLGESLLLGGNPVLVEAALEGVRQVLSPDGGEGAETTGGLDVADQANNDERGSLDDGDGLDDLLLVGLGAGAVQVAHDVGHAGLVAEESRKVGLDRLVILGERLDAATDVGGTLAGQETQRAVARGVVLTMRHLVLS